MKNISFASIILMSAVFALNAEEPVCHHCEEIREYNAKYHQNYEYYEDYLKSEKGKQQPEQKKTVNKAAKPL